MGASAHPCRPNDKRMTCGAATESRQPVCHTDSPRRQVHALVRPLPVANKLLDREPNVARNPPQQERRYVATAVKRDCRHSTVRMPKLLVRPPLPDFSESKPL